MSTRCLRRRLAIPAALVVSIAGAGAALVASCSSDGSPEPDAGVTTLPNQDARADGTPDSMIDAGLTPDALVQTDAPVTPPDAAVPADAPVPIDAEPMG